MPSWLLKPLAAIGVFLLAIGAAFFKGRSAGREKERAKHIDRILENAKKAKRARRRVIDNLDHADKLRKRFTRK